MTPAEAYKNRIRSTVESWRDAARDGRDRPRRKNTSGLEHDEQRKVVAWLRAHSIRYFSVPNAAKRSHSQAAHARSEGLSAGVPDLIITTPPPCGGYAAAAIEMKRLSGGALTIEQYEWLEHLKDVAWATHVAAGATDAITWLEGLGYGQ